MRRAGPVSRELGDAVVATGDLVGRHVLAHAVELGAEAGDPGPRSAVVGAERLGQARGADRR